MKKYILIAGLAFPSMLLAQNAEPVPAKGIAPAALMDENVWLMTFILVILFTVIIVMTQSIRKLTKALLAKDGVAEVDEPVEDDREYRQTIWQRLSHSLTRSVPVTHEEDVMLHHNYDGIRELDNKLPPWWLWGFYLTIIFAVVYIFHYHLADTGKLSIAEYNDQIQIAESERQQRIAKAADYVTESNVVALSDAASLSEGNNIFLNLCQACHGDKGQGLVGPNLTDNYWIHGGKISDLFRTIVDGVPAKGMISWKSQLSPKQIQQVSSYILTLKGSNPPNPKAPQGDLFISPADSAQLPAPADSALQTMK